MEIWVAGATGVLGRHVVPLLLENGHTVTGLARDKSKWPDAPEAMRFIPCDVTVAGQVLQAFGMNRPEAVVNLATALPDDRPTHATWTRNDAVRRAGTQNLLEAALTVDAFFVELSTHYVCAPQGENYITEDSPFQHSSTVDSAIDAERATTKGMNIGLRAAILRSGTVYSAHSGQTRALVSAVRNAKPVQLGHGQNYWSMLHPYDAATAILKVLDRQPAGETFNLCDDEPMRMADCLAHISAELHAHPPKSISPFLAKLAVGGDSVDMLTSSRRVSNAKIKGALEWKPRYPSFREGFAAEFLNR